MDKLSIFSRETAEVTLKSDADNSIDNVVDELQDISKEVKFHRQRFEELTGGEFTEDSDIEEE